MSVKKTGKLYQYVVVDDLNCKLHYCETQADVEKIIATLPFGLYTVKPSTI